MPLSQSRPGQLYAPTSYFLKGRKIVLITLLALTALGSLLFGPLNMIQSKDYVFGAAQFSIGILALIVIRIVWRTSNITPWALLFLIQFFAQMIWVHAGLGTKYSDNIYIWSYLIPVISFFMLGKKLGGLVLAAALIPCGYFVYTQGLAHVFVEKPTLQLLNYLISMIAIILMTFHYENQRATAEAKLSHLAARDPLTDLYNRGFLLDRFQQELDIALRNATPLSGILLDLDDFKAINDAHGHTAGDSALLHLVRVFKAHTRISDTVARLGGDEFFIILPNTTLEQAKLVAKNIKGGLEEDPFILKDNAVILEASFGVVEMDPKHTSFNEFYTTADRRMYTGKHTGKNTIICEDPNFQ